MDLATEILHDLKRENKRKQKVIYALICVIVLLITIGILRETTFTCIPSEEVNDAKISCNEEVKNTINDQTDSQKSNVWDLYKT